MAKEFDRNAIRSADDLHQWIQTNLDLTIPRTPVIAGHAAPFEYITHTFFEGQIPSEVPGGAGLRPAIPDCIVWANRGGGKTFLGALATALDLLFKPGIQVRILAGSLEQASRMHEHLRTLFERDTLKHEVQGRITDRRISLKNKSRVELLAQSQASVRGVRPHKLRCDEVELFDPDVWDAAQLTTRSATIQGRLVRGAIECLSTMHRPHGLMSRLIAESAGGSRTLFKWGIVDVLDRCNDDLLCSPSLREGAGGWERMPGRESDSTQTPTPPRDCPLFSECRGTAKGKRRTPGHISIPDALGMKSRVSLAIWDSEMLCNRPSRRDSVIPEFDRARHVVESLPWEAAGAQPALIIGGMDFGFRSPTVFLWGAVEAGRISIIDERCESGLLLDTHIRAILESPHPRPAWIGADPAGHNRHEQSGASNITILQRAGLAVRARRCPTADGLALIRARLAPADNSPPRLYIHKRCRRLIESLEQYHFDPDRPFRDEPVKDGPDHAVDALRYMVTNLDFPYTSCKSRYA